MWFRIAIIATKLGLAAPAGLKGYNEPQSSPPHECWAAKSREGLGSCAAHMCNLYQVNPL